MTHARADYEAELRRCIALSFSVKQLERVAGDLGLADRISWSRGLADAARDLVKVCDRQGELAKLVASLKAARPLVEWPEAPSDPGEEFAPPDAPVPVADATLAADSQPASQGDGSGPSTDASPPADASSDAAPTPAAPTPEGADKTIPDPYLMNDELLRGPPGGPASQPLWPGTTDPDAKPPSRGIDPKILVVVAALTVLAAVFAFGAGRLSTGPSPAASASAGDEATTAPPKPRRAEGPAALAAGALDRGLASVARACEVQVTGGGPPSAIVLRRAFEHCGPRAAPSMPSVAIPPAADATEAPPADDAPRVPRPPKPPREDPPPSGGPDNACISSCDGQHKSCKSACGPEPQQSTQYADYQACLGRCLTTASKCRLRCK